MSEKTESADAMQKAELGFTFTEHKSGSVQILHHGRLAVTLRGPLARDFMAEVTACGDSDQQQLMARLTGNFKRGNERTAKHHPRNKR
jgi:hypothetical protein